MKRSTFTLLVLSLILSVGNLFAKEEEDQSKDVVDEQFADNKDASGSCAGPTAQIELNINNVRTRLLNGGDMWWDLNSAKYEVPKVEPDSDQNSRNSLFAGALWVGGVDALGQLKVAAQTYRLRGNDFYAGPLDQNGQVSEVDCSKFDQFWEVKGDDIDDYLDLLEEARENNVDCPTLELDDIHPSILQWPARNNSYFEEFDLPADKDLAPFFDCNGDNEYDPLGGDYPVLDGEIEGVYADQMIWWVMNDRGNDHSSTGGQAIGLEIGALAFAYATNDEINNMTFYSYNIANYSTLPLDSVFFGVFADPDLGEYTDDFVGCDTANSLGIVYNGDALDGPSEEAYLGLPPMLGIDFFQGPKDENGVQLGMSSFVYYDNNLEVTGNPETATHYYQYLAGYWKDGTPMTFGGNGYGGSVQTQYMFPTDPSVNGTASEGIWSECAAGNDPFDRRFVQSSGPFKLLPGAVNDLIIGVVWVDDVGGCGSGASFDALLKADQKAQALFDSQFIFPQGPDAPSLTIRELDQELVISLWNAPSSNNFREQFVEKDIVLTTQGFADSMFHFQGYQVYQLAKSTVSAADLDNRDLARPIAVVDVANDGITRLINYEYSPDLDQLLPEIKAEGSDNGIRHTFHVTQDLFAEGDRSLVNNKSYYFMAIAYAANDHQPYNPNQIVLTDQQTPYLAGRKNIRTYTAIPHLSGAEMGGTVLNTFYGEGPQVTQIQGTGNGGMELELTAESVKNILENGYDSTPTYEGGSGPIDVKIYDPFLIQGGEYELRLERNEFVDLPQETDKGGELWLNDDGTVEYEPPQGLENGFDSFTYELFNENCLVDKASVLIKVGFALEEGQAFDDTYSIYDFNHSENCDFNEGCDPITLDVLANDAIGANPLITEVSQVSHGSVEISSDASTLIYTGEFEYFGTVEFQYTLSAEGETNKATVHLNILDPSEQNEFDAKDDIIELPSEGGILSILDNDLGATIGADFIPASSTWVLENLTNGKIYESERNIKSENEQAIGGWERDDYLWLNQDDLNNEEKEILEEYYDPQGFTVSVAQVPFPSVRNAIITADVSFENVESRWLTTLSDADGNNSFEWIRSGNLASNNLTQNPLNVIPDYSTDLNNSSNPEFYDKDGWYEQILEGGIAPYCLANNVPSLAGFSNSEDFLTISPACSDCYGVDPVSPFFTNAPTNNLDAMASVDIVLTDDKDLWTKVPVIEMGRDAANNVGGARKNNLRKSPSRDKDGNEVSGIGISWFPGYAINVETGERLNMMFSENSFSSQNGRDLLFNPTSLITLPSTGADQPASSYKMGGEHWVYVMQSRYSEAKVAEYAANLNASIQEATTLKKSVYDEVMYVATTILERDFEMKSIEDGLVPSDLKVRIRISKAYMESDNGANVYRFSLDEFSATTNNTDEALSALNDVRVVPNPYYGFSEYENSKFDNTVKLTNLPARATVRIFSVDGTFVRDLGIDNTGLVNGSSLVTRKGGQKNSLEWDLKNHKGVPIASGVYIINIEAPELGESINLKWFGVLREIDLDTF